MRKTILAVLLLLAACGGEPRLLTVKTGPAVSTPLEARWHDEAVTRWSQVATWNAVSAIGYRVQLDFAAAVHRHVTERAARSTTRSSAGSAGYAIAEGGTGRCGGSLPSCAVMMCESRGDIHAENPSSSASGKWQILSSTWNGFMGYPTASSAPEWVQDEKARQLYANGAGRGHWAC